MVEFKMVGRDLNSAPTQYRTWVVPNTPDFDGYYYSGLKSGDSPFVDVTAYHLDGYDGYDGYHAGFLLPDPLTWKTTKKTLPSPVANSQFAIIDGYAYLFGGELTDVILRADINNPADWADTGARLPLPLAGSHLAILDDGYMYLIGGTNDGYLAVDTIYSSHTSDPLTWTDEGSHLPRTLRQGQLAILDGYMYLFGGKEINVATDVIFRAPVSDPLNWIDTGERLPDKLYGSHIAFINDVMYLFGGLLFPDSPTANIYAATFSAPLVWTQVAVLPWAIAYGQFVAIGNKGYLFTPGAYPGNQPYLTRILRCDLAAPLIWKDTKRFIDGNPSQSQLGIIYDRIFLFGGSGSSVIFACDQKYKFSLGPDLPSYFYGETTRVNYPLQTNGEDRTFLLGFPYWLTDYAT